MNALARGRAAQKGCTSQSFSSQVISHRTGNAGVRHKRSSVSDMAFMQCDARFGVRRGNRASDFGTSINNRGACIQSRNIGLQPTDFWDGCSCAQDWCAVIRCDFQKRRINRQGRECADGQEQNSCDQAQGFLKHKITFEVKPKMGGKVMIQTTYRYQLWRVSALSQ